MTARPVCHTPRAQHWLSLLLGIFVVLCAVNNVTLPLFEAPDEGDHFHYADLLAREQRLPDLTRDLRVSHEIVQPPLYYVLVAVVIAPIDRSNLADISHLNPDWFDVSVNADHRSVTNQYLHSTEEGFPYKGAALAVHMARLVSTMLGALTVFLVYQIARSLLRAAYGEGNTPEAFQSLPLLAAALVALNPKFIDISSIVSNDIAITFTASLVCWWLVQMWRLEPEEWKFTEHKPGVAVHLRSRNKFILRFSGSSLMLGAMVGLAVLSKVSGLGLLVPALLLIALLVLVKRLSLRLAFLAGLLVAAGLLAVTGVWLAYNQLSYGNPLAWAQVQAANQSLLRPQPLTLVQMVRSIPEILISYWGVIGVELRYPSWVDVFFYAGLAVAAVGCVWLVVRWVNSSRSKDLAEVVAGAAGPVLILLAWELSLLGSYGWWLRDYAGTENSRLIFPGIALVACAVAAGWLSLAPRRWRVPVISTVCAALTVLSALTPFLLIQPAFATPRYLSSQDRAALPGQTGVTFGGKIFLQHAQINQREVLPGGELGISLYWGAAQPLKQSYHAVLAARDAQGQVIGRLEQIPYGGRFDTQRWQPGQIFRDDYLLHIDATARRGIASVELSVRGVYENPPLLTIDGSTTNQFTISSFKVLGALQPVPAPQHAFTATFAAGGERLIQLQGYDLLPVGDARALALHWLCLQAPGRDYTLFVHVLDRNGAVIAQQDAPPLGGAYPTSMWDAQEQIVDRRAISLPASASSLIIGWYLPTDNSRLAAYKPDGSAWPDSAVVIELR